MFIHSWNSTTLHSFLGDMGYKFMLCTIEKIPVLLLIYSRERNRRDYSILYLELLFSNLNREVQMIVPSDFYVYPTDMLKRNFSELITENPVCGLKIF